MIDTFINSLKIDRVQHHEDLKVIFLRSSLVSDMDIRIFDDMKDFVEVKEISDDGEVPYLTFLNKSPHKIICLSGSLISGNFQDRTIKTGFILYPHEETRKSVFCCEQGRWKDKISKGIKSRYHLSSDIRKSLRSSEQYQIWRMIKEKSERMGVRSPSSNIHDIYENRKTQIETFQDAFKCDPDDVGIITLMHDKVMSMEVFAIKGLYSKCHDSVLTSIIVDTLDKQVCQEVQDRKPLSVDAFLKAITKAKRNHENGQLVTFESKKVVGDGLVDHGVLLELEAFAV